MVTMGGCVWPIVGYDCPHACCWAGAASCLKSICNASFTITRASWSVFVLQELNGVEYRCMNILCWPEHFLQRLVVDVSAPAWQLELLWWWWISPPWNDWWWSATVSSLPESFFLIIVQSPCLSPRYALVCPDLEPRYLCSQFVHFALHTHSLSFLRLTAYKHWSRGRYLLSSPYTTRYQRQSSKHLFCLP